MSSAESDGDNDERSQADSSTNYQSGAIYSEVPSQAPTPEVGPNRVQELIDDNLSLRMAIGKTADSLSFEYSKLEGFHQILKEKARQMMSSYQQLQDALSERDRANALLKADKVKLQQELMAIKYSGMAIEERTKKNEEEDEKFKAEFDDTVSNLQSELVKCVEEKRNLNIHYQQQFVEMEKTWKSWGIKLRTDYNNFMEKVQAEHNFKIQEQLREHETITQGMKDQVTSVIREVRICRARLQDKEKELESAQSQVEKKEGRIYQLSRDVKSLEDRNRTLTETIIHVRQELDEARRQVNEKDDSLDQLFKVYNEELEKSQKTGAGKLKIQEELDKVYAQYLSAEESIKKKNDEIEALRERVRERHRSEGQISGAEIDVWKQQADIFKKDFEMEREAHVQSHQENVELKKLLSQYELEMQKLKTEIMKYHHQAHHQYQPRQ